MGRAWILAVVAALATGCAGLGESPDDAPNVLTTMGFGLPDEHATARVGVFRQKYPGIDLRITEGAFDEQQFLSAVASGEPPDLVYADRIKLGGFAARGAVQPIDDCLRRHRVDMSVFRPAAVRQVTVDGHTYGLPDFATVKLMILNNPALRAAGIDPATLPTDDWQALAEQTRKVTAVDGGRIRRIGFDPKLPDFFPLWAKANGVELISPDGRAAVLDDPKVVEAMRFTTDLVKAQAPWASFKAFKDGFDEFGAGNQYAKDQLAAMPMDSFYINTLATNSPDVDVTVKPMTDRTGTPFTELGGQAWAIPRGAAHPEQACDFLVTMTAKDTWVTAAKARRDGLAAKGRPYGGTFTANRDADAAIFSEVYRPAGNRIVEQGVPVVLSLQEKAFALPPSPAAPDLVRVWRSAAIRVLGGEQTAEAALAQAQREADLALRRVIGR
ncbi:extracellular solute-binding protein [Kibdelosporangium persicum]|uniref:Periplasmic substrate-binding component of ABC-type sugar transport system n=1 Tax=Kibdelosporangium persicum TaxID=2698649 RepID=A0ABX2EVY1_9PSEU|nr:extracellular solute-binding protein [Kibdelosporangium persicum]NRN63188.1 Periplasmic substrate-binding component of ABC-type sugar transport system [Kibdelosporangium persicum]